MLFLIFLGIKQNSKLSEILSFIYTPIELIKIEVNVILCKGISNKKNIFMSKFKKEVFLQ